MTTNESPRNPKEETSILRRQDLAMVVNAFLSTAAGPGGGGEDGSRKEQRQYVRRIQMRYWPMLDEILTAAAARRRGALELSDEERLFIDLGLVDPRMVGGSDAGPRVLRTLLAEVRQKGLSGSYYLSEWLTYRQQQAQLESELDVGDAAGDSDYEGQLSEARRRVLNRLSTYLTGLPGVSMEVSSMVRTGDLDRAVIASGIAAMRKPSRKNYLRRHRLWALREQVLSKARARAENQSVLRLFEMLNEVYIREWRVRHDALVSGAMLEETPGLHPSRLSGGDTRRITPFNPSSDPTLREARRMRMRMQLLEAVDGRDESDTILHSDGPRLDKTLLASLMPVAQAFDRGLTDPPPIVIVPGMGRGIFAWESGCLILALQPLVTAEDSLATGLAWMRMLNDRFLNGDVLRAAYEQAFPGANFNTEFPADYRSWLCRLTRGDLSALDAEHRTFFRDHIGPDLKGPLLPPNLRNVGPQTMMAICRRLEKQVASGDGGANLHRRLAALYWQQGEMESAGLQYNMAMQLAPGDGETLFSAGMFMRGRDEGEAAADCFRMGVEKASSTMWGVYCHDALEGLF